MAILKTLLVSLAFAVVGGIVGLLIFAFQVQRGWWDGPGGGMIFFPMVLIPAIGSGLYGFIRSRRRFPHGSNLNP
jgi:phosphate/sulfate permease